MRVHKVHDAQGATWPVTPRNSGTAPQSVQLEDCARARHSQSGAELPRRPCSSESSKEGETCRTRPRLRQIRWRSTPG